MTEIQYITDSQGHKTAAILPIDEYEEFLADLDVANAVKESKGEPIRDLEEVLAEMKTEGELDV
jgi:hypothetical protein